MKNEMMQEIENQLSAMGVSVVKGGQTDLSVDVELLDAGFSTGKKKIRYETSILLDESEKAVRMYEKTTETSAGISFGSSGESTFQSGSTLFRKVKSVQYGPEGKVYEYNFDIGAIAKAVKTTAKAHGWSFKTVILKKKALYR
jgi:hypothetical protein